MDVRTLCLGIIANGETTGYEIRKLFQGPLREFYDVSFGAIYPALAKLQAEGLIEGRTETQDGRPNKKIYRITPMGHAELVKALDGHPNQDVVRSDFIAMMLFAHFMKPDHVSRLIDHRLGMHREALAAFYAKQEGGDLALPAASRAFLCGLGEAIHQAALAYIERNRHLIEKTLLEPPKEKRVKHG